ncbi:hypothetical protein [Arthrobacter sp. efr-133-TYG-104]|uniref:hypothetical protein n=1 Tax=Arthrobacter sp. efr-133-TYG-104 TaxID=3040324 RepID=UPI00254A3866|nr:hypothetical protein [Arthrobacter sp. efr-133-TYG-104]
MNSQEERPIRSRRELRRAREEQPEPQANQSTGLDAGPGSAVDDRAQARNRRAADAPVDAVGAAAQERSSQVRARDRATLRTIKELAGKEEQLSGGGPPTRRQLRLQQLQAEVATSAHPIVPMPGAPGGSAQPSSEKQPANASVAASQKAKGAPSESEMSVEQALAVRELIAAQVQNQTAKLEHIAEQDPLTVDPAVLAEQIALAERAAVLNKRAAARQKLAEQTQAGKAAAEPATQAVDTQAAKSPPGKAHPGKSQPTTTATPTGSQVTSGPSTANNLAMVTPLEFVKVPGVERPVMKRPSTTFVPLVTSAAPKVDQAKASKQRGTRGRSGVLARAEAVARSARNRPQVSETAEEKERPPVPANTAYGLDPLDANTAGLARAQRARLLQFGVLALGVVALIVGIIMIAGG